MSHNLFRISYSLSDIEIFNLQNVSENKQNVNRKYVKKNKRKMN